MSTSASEQTLDLEGEIARRRTFAIISHPDAGKTTLTEKLLLYAGAIKTAGMVRARKNQQSATSDWLDIERERGISVSSSAMRVPYKGYALNILDTPGHQDFSEDTYRTLLAADAAVMVLDASKGVEAQTLKLFAVCRRRGIPILTFINKLDLNALEPLALLSDIERALGIRAVPMNWPIGAGRSFAGVVDLETRTLLAFERGAHHGALQAVEHRARLDDPACEELLDGRLLEQAREDLELLSSAGNPFVLAECLAGAVTPVFFGSAMNNFGVEAFFDRFVELAPAPGSREALVGDTSVTIDPIRDSFSGFVFKLQANMDKNHRDSMAFLRICSGRFEKDLVVKHHRTGRDVRLSRPYSTFARERETIDVAYPGDVIGVVNRGVYMIGDTLSVRGGFEYPRLPQLAPNLIARIRPRIVGNRKGFDRGMEQLVSEGTVQLFTLLRPTKEPVIAAVGRLQFDVLQHRLRGEYGAETELGFLSYNTAAWVRGDVSTFKTSSGLAVDAVGRHLALFVSQWDLDYTAGQNKQLTFVDCI
jgi:peptide chain release factor 3